MRLHVTNYVSSQIGSLTKMIALGFEDIDGKELSKSR